jgi:hypothetical protein
LSVDPSTACFIFKHPLAFDKRERIMLQGKILVGRRSGGLIAMPASGIAVPVQQVPKTKNERGTDGHVCHGAGTRSAD